MGKLYFEAERSWRKTWEEGRGWSLISPRLRKTDAETFYQAAHFVGGAMLASGFRLFHNGGLPLLERRSGPLIEEIVIEPGRRMIKGAYVPLSVKVHISHEGMRAVRERYWSVPSRAPIVIASGHLGLVDFPPGWVIWDVASGGRDLEDLARWVQDLAVKWFANFEEPETLRDRVLRREVPLVRAADALEFVLAEKGRDSARRFLRELVEFGGVLSPTMEPLVRVDEHAPLKSRLDAIATCYRLR